MAAVVPRPGLAGVTVYLDSDGNGRWNTGEPTAVTDASGASVPDGTVKVTQTQTNESREVTTNESGGYTLSSVPAGTYSVSISKAGFRSASTTEQGVNGPGSNLLALNRVSLGEERHLPMFALKMAQLFFTSAVTAPNVAMSKQVGVAAGGENSGYRSRDTGAHRDSGPRVGEPAREDAAGGIAAAGAANGRAGGGARADRPRERSPQL